MLSIGAAYAAFVGLLKMNFSELIAFAAAIAVAILLYCLFVALLGIIGKDDLKLIPIVGKLIKEE